MTETNAKYYFTHQTSKGVEVSAFIFFDHQYGGFVMYKHTSFNTKEDALLWVHSQKLAAKAFGLSQEEITAWFVQNHIKLKEEVVTTSINDIDIPD